MGWCTSHAFAHANRCALVSLLLSLPLFLPSCIADNTPRDTPAPAQAPADSRPGKLIPAASGSFQDTDGNLYRDSSTVVIYTFAESAKYQIPMRPQGEFQIRLEDNRGGLIASWSFSKEQTKAALRNLPPGPGCVFQLDLRQSAVTGFSDRINKGEASMVVTLKPDQGDPVTARTSAPILIGPIETAR